MTFQPRHLRARGRGGHLSIAGALFDGRPVGELHGLLLVALAFVLFIVDIKGAHARCVDGRRDRVVHSRIAHLVQLDGCRPIRPRLHVAGGDRRRPDGRFLRLHRGQGGWLYAPQAHDQHGRVGRTERYGSHATRSRRDGLRARRVVDGAVGPRTGQSLRQDSDRGASGWISAGREAGGLTLTLSTIKGPAMEKNQRVPFQRVRRDDGFAQLRFSSGQRPGPAHRLSPGLRQNGAPRRTCASSRRTAESSPMPPWRPATARDGGDVFNIGIIAPTATHPDYRHRGYAAACVADCIKVMEEQDCVLSVLWTQEATFPFYQRLGYEAVASQGWAYSLDPVAANRFERRYFEIMQYVPTDQSHLNGVCACTNANPAHHPFGG